MVSKPSFVYVTYIKANPEVLGEAITNGGFTRKYGDRRRTESSWEPGSPVLLRREGDTPPGVTGEVLTCDPPNRLAYTWEVTGEEEPPSRVTFELRGVGSETKLTVTHDELDPDGEVYFTVGMGWPAILSSLKSFLETGESLKITANWKG